MGLFGDWATRANRRVKESEEQVEFRDLDDVKREPRVEPVAASTAVVEEKTSGSSLNATGTGDSGRVNMKFSSPSSYASDAGEIADYLLEGYIVVLDVEFLPKSDIIRLLDFLNGITYVIDGTITQRNPKTFVITPSNVDIDK